MEKISKRFILSIVTVVLLAFTLGTTTFAWFTLSARATLGDLTGEITGGDGLQIALGLNDEVITEYRTNLRADDWQEVMNKINEGKTTDLEKFRFGAVSTRDGINFDKLDLVEGNLVSRLNKKALTTTNDKDGYLEFNVYFKSGSVGVINWDGYGFVENDKTSTNFKPDSSYIQTDIKDATKETKDAIDVSASNAARIAVSSMVEETILESDDDYDVDGPATRLVEKTVIVQKGTDATNTVMAIDAIDEVTYAVDKGQFTYLTNKGYDLFWSNTNKYDDLKLVLKTYKLDSNKMIEEDFDPKIAEDEKDSKMLISDVILANAYTNLQEVVDGVAIGKNIIKLELVVPELLYTKKDIEDNADDEDFTFEVGDIKRTADPSKGYIASVTVRVWLEGFDTDAYDAIFKLGLNFNLTFKKGPA